MESLCLQDLVLVVVTSTAPCALPCSCTQCPHIQRTASHVPSRKSCSYTPIVDRPNPHIQQTTVLWQNGSPRHPPPPDMQIERQTHHEDVTMRDITIHTVLDPVAGKMDPVRPLHQAKYFLEWSIRWFQEGETS
ncbi:hypothetical protein L210DRAFT_3548450 [Boletus edulis BED1]|uniref:Uncharacterized protein n=1 Tax=Boletus edulis BED1 TaxID=1328754 RepID=A0AAD4BQE6_BOLED|nr:hypothetical protein L210DRAFT_3548450 [Boletus edulis BED1]